MVKAAILIIGNEILSGQVQELNSNFLSNELGNLGIRVKKIVIIEDDECEIISNILNIKDKYDYVFVTGGIGPTHDDITTSAIAKAFNRNLFLHEQSAEAIKKYFIGKSKEIVDSALKMAYLPESVDLIENPLSNAPGFIIENIYVMAGVPSIMQAMFNSVKHNLKKGERIYSKNLDVEFGESYFAKDFSDLQKKYQNVEMGSYPYNTQGCWRTNLVLKSSNLKDLELAFRELDNIFKIKNK